MLQRRGAQDDALQENPGGLTFPGKAPLNFVVIVPLSPPRVAYGAANEN